MTINRILFVLCAVFLSGCASSPYTYHVEPTPLEKGTTKYKIEDVIVNLQLGHGAIEGDESFASQKLLTEQFTDALKKSLIESNVFATEESENSATLVVMIDYLRTFNYGGKALNKPQISHAVLVQKNEQKLASFEQSKYTTKYGTFEELAIGVEIAAFNWGAEDEIRDVNHIAQFIVKDIAELGK